VAGLVPAISIQKTQCQIDGDACDIGERSDAVLRTTNQGCPATPLCFAASVFAHILFPLGMPGIVSALHTHPDSGPVAEQFAKPDCNRRRNRLPFAQYVVEMLA
jgi:hypothetical protein